MPDLLKDAVSAVCFHCGEACHDGDPVDGDKHFCCHGCQTVYKILSSANLDTYYRIEERPGFQPSAVKGKKYEFLQDESVQASLLDFDDGKRAIVTLSLPQIHCSACIWLLERLHKLNKGISSCRVDFLRTELTVTFDKSKISSRQLAELLDSLGYPPMLSLEQLGEKPLRANNRSIYLRLGVAGFAFANIMLLSLPDYFAIDSVLPSDFSRFLGLLSLLLALPVLFYSSSIYFLSAITAAKQKVINMDMPISLGILALFGRSLVEVLSGGGPGYLDSFTGLVFFLLIGRVYQKKTYDRLRFDRDYRSYFPISVIRISPGQSERLAIPLTDVVIGDRLLVRNRELIPGDAVLLSDQATIDYSYVTGESDPVIVKPGEHLFAGGRQIGGSIEIKVTRSISQSYLTRLWDHQTMKEEKSAGLGGLANRVAGKFTLVIIAIALGAAGYWLMVDPSQAVNVAIAVLIVACPCALALSTPFAFGTSLRLLSQNKCHLRSADVVENIAGIDSVVFDKTGTLTENTNSDLHYNGDLLTNETKSLLRSLVKSSTHSVSQAILSYLGEGPEYEVASFQETIGSGISGDVNGHYVQLGRSDWMLDSNRLNGFEPEKLILEGKSGGSWFAIDSVMVGSFYYKPSIRERITEMIEYVKSRYSVAMLSGDNDRQTEELKKLLGDDSRLLFFQKPEEKLSFVECLEAEGNRVLMVGDGLNDAGALRAASVGMAVAGESSVFSPASDGIISGNRLSDLHRIIRFCRKSVNVIKVCFLISFLYNSIGLWLAVSGQLSPLVAAVLMPISSLSVVLFATGATILAGRTEGLD